MERLDHDRLIQDKRKFSYAISGLIVLIILAIPFPHSYSLWEWMLKSLSIPTEFKFGSGSTLILTGLPMLVLLIVCLRLLYRSLGRSSVSLCIIALVITFWLPDRLVTAYQSTLASGIYTLDAKESLASCKVKANDGDWNGHCNLAIVNYGRSPVHAKVVLKREEHGEKWPELQHIDLGEHTIDHGHQGLYVPISIPFDSDHDYSSVSLGYYDVIISDSSHSREFLRN